MQQSSTRKFDKVLPCGLFLRLEIYEKLVLLDVYVDVYAQLGGN